MIAPFVRKPGGGLMSKCCCEDDCLTLIGNDKGLEDASFDRSEGYERDMCVVADVTDYQYIWNPWLLLDAMSPVYTDPNEHGIVPSLPLFPPYGLPQPITSPPTPPRTPVTGIGGGSIYKMVSGTSDDVLPFPDTDLDEDESQEPCWNLQKWNKFHRSENLGDVSYRVGTLTFADGARPNSTITLPRQIQGMIIGAWTTDEPFPYFGKIIRSGDRQGWFENPLMMRKCIISVHSRWRRSYYWTGCGPGMPPSVCEDNRPSPTWPEGWIEGGYSNRFDRDASKNAQKYTSAAQNIQWEATIRVKTYGT